MFKVQMWLKGDGRIIFFDHTAYYTIRWLILMHFTTIADQYETSFNYLTFSLVQQL